MPRSEKSIGLARLLLVAMACCCGASCDSKRSAIAPATQSATPRGAEAATEQTGQTPEVASLAPAATDLIIGMGAGDHLVAVSNFDAALPNLPRVGDYQNTDWEKLGELRPKIMIVQMDESRIPPGLRDRAAAQGTTLVNIQIERLEDIFRTLDQLGAALEERDKASVARISLSGRLTAVRERVAGEAPVATLLTLDDDGSFAAGPGTFLDDLLALAGGKNVLVGTQQHWPSIDKERLLALAPDAVIELLPGASPQVTKRAADFWLSVPSVPAVLSGRTYQMTDAWVMMPGYHVADLAENMAAVLHPAAASTRRSPTQAAQ